MFDLIRRYGGIPSRYVSRQTDLLIVGDLSRNNNTSNKLERAKQLGIPIITEDEFYGLVDIDP